MQSNSSFLYPSEMSDAPETDDIARGNHVVPTEWAQQLERERDEAREALNNIRINLGEDADGFTLLHAVCALQNERDEAREEAHRFRSLSYARSGIDKSASWFPWETSLNLAQKAQLLATEKHAK